MMGKRVLCFIMNTQQSILLKIVSVLMCLFLVTSTAAAFSPAVFQERSSETLDLKSKIDALLAEEIRAKPDE